MWRGVVQVPHSYGHCPDFPWGGAFYRFLSGRGVVQIPHGRGISRFLAGRGIVHMARSPSEVALQRVKYARWLACWT